MWANKWTCPRFIDRIYSFSHESFMADRTGQDSTMLHYLAVQQAMVSVHRPVHSKITVTYMYAFTWQTDCWQALDTLENGFRSITKHHGSLFSKFCSNLLCAYCSNELPERGPTEARLHVLSIMPLQVWVHWRSAYAQLSPLYLISTFSLPSTSLTW